MASLKMTTLCVFLLSFASFHLLINGRHHLTPMAKEKASNPGFYLYSLGWQTKPGAFYGAHAQMSLWSISDMKNHSSSGYYISIDRGEQDSIDVGFKVNPTMYNDTKLHFTTSWYANNNITSGHSSGCLDTRCPGFVVANGAILQPGQVMSPPFSTYNKDDHSIILSIKKDQETKDWVLYYSTSPGNTTKLGWWPSTLFHTGFEFADTVSFTGMTFFRTDILPGPAMGSGHLADEGEKKAAYFKQITLFDKNGKEYVPSPKEMEPADADANCYSISELKETQDHGRMFYYGGPNCKPE